jgi:hypothetical protein
MKDEIIFKAFKAEDIELQTQIMTRAFNEDSRRHLKHIT